MAVTKETYYQLFDAHVRDINTNGTAIETGLTEIAKLEMALKVERDRVEALKNSRKAQFVQLKGVREIIRKLEDAEVAEQRAAEDEATE